MKNFHGKKFYIFNTFNFNLNLLICDMIYYILNKLFNLISLFKQIKIVYTAPMNLREPAETLVDVNQLITVVVNQLTGFGVNCLITWYLTTKQMLQLLRYYHHLYFCLLEMKAIQEIVHVNSLHSAHLLHLR